jgi:hypothetical protein
MQTKESHQSLFVIRQVNMAEYDVFLHKYDDEMSNSHTHHHYTPEFSRVLVDYFGYDGQEQDQTPPFLILSKKARIMHITTSSYSVIVDNLFVTRIWT